MSAILDPHPNQSTFAEMFSAVRGLGRITILQQQDLHLPFIEWKESCPALIRQAEVLGHSTSNVLEEVDVRNVIHKWDAYRTNSAQSPVSGRDCRRFCWVPEIVASNHFHQLVTTKQIPITQASLRGLLYSYHAKFDSLGANKSFSETVRILIKARSSATGTFRKWSDSLEYIVGNRAPDLLAKESLTGRKSPEEQLEELELSPTTEFAAAYARGLINLAAARFDNFSPDELQEITKKIFASPLVGRKDFKTAIGKIILSRLANSNEQVQALLIDFVLKSDGIGDPRISPENWAGIEEEAKKRVIQWLSKEDINFFFELLLNNRDDKHGRKSFWLQYVGKVSRSRALICSEHRIRHSVRLKEMSEKGRSYAELTGSTSSSAFVLDFGRIVVVEFSEVNNACYIYGRPVFEELFPEFWASEFPSKPLKNKEVVAERITRSMKDWQSSAQQILSRFGVRRG